MIEVKFTMYPFADCPKCGTSGGRVIKDSNYFEHNIQWIAFECLNCGECFKAS